VLADHEIAFNARLRDHPYATPAGTPTATAPATETSRRIALLPTAAANGFDSWRKSWRVFMRSEFARSSLVSICAGSARYVTTRNATARGRSPSRNTRARIGVRRVPIARVLRIAGSYSTRCDSVRGLPRSGHKLTR